MKKAEYIKEWRRKNRGKVKEYQKDWYRKNPNKRFFWGLQASAKRRGIPFDLTFEDVAYPDHCPILGIPLFRNIGKNGPTANSPSIDKIDPKLGYVKGNIQVISHRANVMKQDASAEELRRFAAWVIKTFPI